MAAPLLFAPANTVVTSDAPTLLGRPSRDMVDMHLKRYDALKSARSVFDSHWQLVSELTWPDWADFTAERVQGERRNLRQFDSTMAYALERFAAVLESFLTPRAQKWHELRASNAELDKVRSVREWFDNLTNVLHQQRSRPESGFYGAMQIVYKSHGAFGNGALSIEPSRRGGIGYMARHIKDLVVAHDDQGRIDTVYECYRLSHRSAAIRFGTDVFPMEMREKLKNTPYEKNEYVRCVYPNSDFIGRFGQRPFYSIDIHVPSKEAFGWGEFFELPTVYSRYTLNPNEDYGRGPAMVALADNLTLQEMEKTHLRAGELIAYPPLLTPSDGEFGVGGSTVDMRSGALNPGGLSDQGEQLIKPLLTGGRIDVTYEMMQQKRINIRSAMLLDVFEALIQNPQMTATQVMQLLQERGVITAPIVGRLQSELLGQIIHRDIGLAIRMGLVPPAPPELVEARGDYRVEYTSPATRSQRAEELVGITRTVEIAAPWINSDPSYLEVFDGEEVIRLAAEVTGVPAKVIRTPEELAKIRESQAAARAEQDQLAALPDIAKAAASATAAAKDAQGVPAIQRELSG